MQKKYFLGLSEEGFHRNAYTEWGEANHEQLPIICLHGLTRNGRDFDSLASYLCHRGHHLYCPDLVGRGDSDWLKNPLHYTYEQYVADMNTLTARTGASQINWIGTSLGGLVGMILASLPNTPIRRLIMNDIGPQIPLKGITRLSKYAGKDPEFHSFEEAKQYYKTVHAEFGNLSEAQWETLTEHSIRQIAPNRYISKIDHHIKISPAKSKMAWEMLMHPHKAFEGTFFDVDLWEVWQKVKCPVLVLRGANSDILPPEVVEKMQETNPHTEAITIPNTGHAPALLDQEQHELIHAWLEKKHI